tara:strand:+ start:416 stop:586 length:171 start_codon:yes stop_codon:yes gene_type:complete
MISEVKAHYKDGTLQSYQLTLEDGKIWHVPNNSENRHYQEIQQWISEGNTVIDSNE